MADIEEAQRFWNRVVLVMALLALVGMVVAGWIWPETSRF